MNIAKMDLGMFLFLRGSTRENSRDLCIVKLDSFDLFGNTYTTSLQKSKNALQRRLKLNLCFLKEIG